MALVFPHVNSSLTGEQLQPQEHLIRHFIFADDGGDVTDDGGDVTDDEPVLP